MHIAVVGGGAAGLAATINAARTGAAVTVFESQDRVGNSIKVTGDGRCNIANAHTTADDYFNCEFVQHAFDKCSPEEAIAFLESTGLLLREEGEGRLYPQTNKATSVIDALRLAAARAGAKEACSKRAVSLQRENNRWNIGFEDGAQCGFDKVVLACGGRVSRSLLPNEVPFNALKPLLGPLATEAESLRGLDKVRAKCSMSCNGHTESGEATFRAYGLSGIAAFNMTRFVSEGDVVLVDFLPEYSNEESIELLRNRLKMLQPKNWLEFTCGMLLPLIARAVLRKAGLSPDEKPVESELLAFHRVLRGFSLEVRGIGDKKLCQVHRGGVDISAIDPHTMQLKTCPNLYVAGEMIDVDGPCGGYNLHWAWISGIVAGRAASCD